jgi:dCTP deaminase
MPIPILLQHPLYFIQQNFLRHFYHHNYLLPILSKGCLLSDHDIIKLIDEKLLIIDPYNPLSLNPSSIDLSLGSSLVKYIPQTIKIGVTNCKSYEIDITHSNYILRPGEFILGTTKEKVSIPNGYQGFIETKGNTARAGLLIRGKHIQVHNNDAHIDPGFCGHITLEIKNMNENDVCIELVQGLPICQLFICKLSSICDSPYKGKYLNQVKPTVYYP